MGVSTPVGYLSRLRSVHKSNPRWSEKQRNPRRCQFLTPGCGIVWCNPPATPSSAEEKSEGICQASGNPPQNPAELGDEPTFPVSEDARSGVASACQLFLQRPLRPLKLGPPGPGPVLRLTLEDFFAKEIR